jgi:phosphatidylserine synthase
MVISPVGTAFAWFLGWKVACALLVIAALSDALDGAIARYWHVTSETGERLDPIADLILMLSALTGLLVTRVWPWWSGVVIVIAAAALWWIDKKVPLGHPLKNFQLKFHPILSVAVLILMLSTYVQLATGDRLVTLAFCVCAGLIAGVKYGAKS